MDLEASKSAIDHVLEHTRGMYGTYEFACAFINSFTYLSPSLARSRAYVRAFVVLGSW
jgi:hypothetical protein